MSISFLCSQPTAVSRTMATCKTLFNRLSFNSNRSKVTADPFSVYVTDVCRLNPSDNTSLADEDVVIDEVWAKILEEARSDITKEPALRGYYFLQILSHKCLEHALAAHLATKLSISDVIPRRVVEELLFTTFARSPEIRQAVRADLRAARDRDPACGKMVHCFLYYKGFLALQTHRAAHRLWTEGRAAAALLLQSRASEVFAVDIHPRARIGKGLLFDHATGVVIGETAVVGDDVSILHGVTLGGTGKEGGDRHPKVEDGVIIGAGAKILGNVRVGRAAKVGAGAVVLKEVPPLATAVGNPARLVGKSAGQNL